MCQVNRLYFKRLYFKKGVLVTAEGWQHLCSQVWCVCTFSSPFVWSDVNNIFLFFYIYHKPCIELLGSHKDWNSERVVVLNKFACHSL